MSTHLLPALFSCISPHTTLPRFVLWLSKCQHSSWLSTYRAVCASCQVIISLRFEKRKDHGICGYVAPILDQKGVRTRGVSYLNIPTDKHTLYIYIHIIYICLCIYKHIHIYIHHVDLEVEVYIFFKLYLVFPWGLLLSQSLTLPICSKLWITWDIPITEVCCIDTMSTICDRIISTLQGFGNQIDAILHAAGCSCTSGSRTSNHPRNGKTQIWRVSLQGIGAYRSPVFAPWGRLHVGMWVCGYIYIYIYIYIY